MCADGFGHQTCEDIDVFPQDTAVVVEAEGLETESALSE